MSPFLQKNTHPGQNKIKITEKREGKIQIAFSF
jgi:hypothetical protein